MAYEAYGVLGLSAAIILTWVALASPDHLRSLLFWRPSKAVAAPVVRAQATIAYTLGPLLDPFVTASSTLIIVGSDGYAFVAPRYLWIRNVEKWLQRGARIKYLLTDFGRHELDAAERLLLEYPDNFDLLVLPPSVPDADAADKDLIARARTCHPTLLEDATNKTRVMWIEGYHPQDCNMAFDCVFLPPEYAKDDPRFDQYKRDLDHLISRYAKRYEAMRAAA